MNDQMNKRISIFWIMHENPTSNPIADHLHKLVRSIQTAYQEVFADILKSFKEYKIKQSMVKKDMFLTTFICGICDGFKSEPYNAWSDVVTILAMYDFLINNIQISTEDMHATYVVAKYCLPIIELEVGWNTIDEF